MRSYTLKKVCGQPDWNTVPVMPIDTKYKFDVEGISAQAQVCWNEEALHVRLCAVEKPLRMEETSETAQVCNDSCLEFFIRPTEKLDYFNFEFNPIRNIYLGYGNGQNGTSELIRLLVRNREKVFGIESKVNEDGWELTFKIPYSFILRFFPTFVAEEGAKMYANAYKCGDKTDHPHYLTWNPIVEKKNGFHCPQEFGLLIFGGECV